ncbi:Bpu10I family restriction endonuclease [Cyanobacterium sp. DS4]|uniref:Bpu10I family restriction endonuclease n=1 Tax=Cyanobacterium sp. DS4 TaxID=2878255 RepID=UPI002E80C547|nr:Bpu10I family restriction endonuclease [Cyanobacterium sp. Dongsha4]WVL00909.1 Bpu10I family restriction endonuclease [Cyanobacterium sp. Dongsha4]
MINLPKPHGEKLFALLNNEKLPKSDMLRIEKTINEYQNWRNKLININNDANTLDLMIKELNEYKKYIDVDLIFDSENDFLYRQKGQLKLDNSIIEEFLPILINNIYSEFLVNKGIFIGPTQCFSSLLFESNIANLYKGGGVNIRSKDQDFAISRKIFIQTSHYDDFRDSISLTSNIAYVAAECKTNLDKTMFQGGAATALDVKNSVPGAKYFLICEWLDMTPISSSLTAIDEILILRKAKRISSNIRSQFSSYKNRLKHRDYFINYLEKYPFSADVFARFLNQIEKAIGKNDLNINDVLNRGYF